MSRNRYTVNDVRAVLDELVDAEPRRCDRRAERGVNSNLRWLDAGQPNCLGAEIFTRLGISTGVLRALDKETGRKGAGVDLGHSRHPLRRRFEPVAWELMNCLQRLNDQGYTWEYCRWEAFHLPQNVPVWDKWTLRRARERSPWITDGNVITAPRPDAFAKGAA